jgi:hypothetical protein
MAAEDSLLFGVDLVKDERTLQAAYDDGRGITAEFNRKLLAVINRELGADFEQSTGLRRSWLHQFASPNIAVSWRCRRACFVLFITRASSPGGVRHRG